MHVDPGGRVEAALGLGKTVGAPSMRILSMLCVAAGGRVENPSRPGTPQSHNTNILLIRTGSYTFSGLYSLLHDSCDSCKSCVFGSFGSSWWAFL